MSILSSTSAGKSFLKITKEYLTDNDWQSIPSTKLGNTYVHPEFPEFCIVSKTGTDIYILMHCLYEKVKGAKESAGGLWWEPLHHTLEFLQQSDALTEGIVKNGCKIDNRPDLEHILKNIREYYEHIK